MPRRFSTKTSLFLIIGSGILVLAMVGGVGLLYLNRVKREWHDFIEVVQGKEQQVMRIREFMGYGGVIHNFKNYLLRGEAGYLETAQTKIRGTLAAIDAYAAQGAVQEIESLSLQRIREMVMAYAQAAQRVRVLRAQGLSATEIDDQVRIDDAPYLASMASLSAELARLTTAKSKRVTREVSHATILLSLIASLGGAFFVFFGASLKRGIESADQALRDENLERRQAEERLRQSQLTLRESETLRDHFVERAFAAQEEERRRIARELHDEAGQALSSLIVGLQEIKESTSLSATNLRAETLQTVAEGIVEELARLARGLHPRLLEDLGFTDAVEHQASETKRIHHVEVHTQMVGLESSDLARPIATALYRIIQEALTNIVKHADATSINLVVSRGNNHVRLIIEDDGCGFDTSQRTGGMGLLGIAERVKMLNGTLELESTATSGTTLAVRIPIEERSA